MPIWLNLCAAVTSGIIAALLGFVLIPFLRRIHFGQTILDEGPAWHKSKQGTPIMGGFLFIIGSIAATALGYTVWRIMGGTDLTDEETGSHALRLLTVMLFSLFYSGACGFTDDFIKAVKKRNEGLNPKQKILFQIVFCAAFLAIMYALGDHETTIDLIFVKLNFGILYYPIMMLFMMFLINAVNLTDGIDGLCGSVTVVTMLVLTVLCASFGERELSLYAITIAGGCIGFLIWNLHPAKCFMGDTGSMYLGGAFGGSPSDVNAYAASTFFSVDRYASYRTDWGAAYERGELILSDRYTTSNAVHQGSKVPEAELPAFFDWLYDLEYNKLGLPRPDLVIYLDVDVETSLARMERRQLKHHTQADIHEKDAAYLERCLRVGHLAAAHYGWRVVPFQKDGEVRALAEKHEEIFQIVRSVL